MKVTENDIENDIETKEYESDTDTLLTDLLSLKASLALCTVSRVLQLIHSDKNLYSTIVNCVEEYHRLFDNVPDDDYVKIQVLDIFHRYIGLNESLRIPDEFSDSDSDDEEKEISISEEMKKSCIE